MIPKNALAIISNISAISYWAQAVYVPHIHNTNTTAHTYIEPRTHSCTAAAPSVRLSFLIFTLAALFTHTLQQGRARQAPNRSSSTIVNRSTGSRATAIATATPAGNMCMKNPVKSADITSKLFLCEKLNNLNNKMNNYIILSVSKRFVDLMYTIEGNILN